MNTHRPPMSRPTYTNGYLPIGSNGYTDSIYHVGGYVQTTVRNDPCNCCNGFIDQIHCQYGKPCSKRIRGVKPDLVNYQC